jgi:hypothetical protein
MTSALAPEYVAAHEALRRTRTAAWYDGLGVAARELLALTDHLKATAPGAPATARAGRRIEP